jgi:hypothetical protein
MRRIPAITQISQEGACSGGENVLLSASRWESVETWTPTPSRKWPHSDTGTIKIGCIDVVHATRDGLSQKSRSLHRHRVEPSYQLVSVSPGGQSDKKMIELLDWMYYRWHFSAPAAVLAIQALSHDPPKDVFKAIFRSLCAKNPADLKTSWVLGVIGPALYTMALVRL